MTVFDVLVNTDDLVVLGPPDIIDVAVSIGEKGTRGATFYVGAGDPNNSTVSENVFGQTVTPISGDVFINTATGPQYGWLYIYNPKITGNQWDEILNLQQPIYSAIAQLDFTSGTATLSIPLSNLTSNSNGMTEDNFVVNITPQNSIPTVISISSKAIVSNELEIDLIAIEYSSSAWQQVSGLLDFNLKITMI